MLRIPAIIVMLFLSVTQTHAQKGFRAAVVKINISPNTPKQLLGYGARLSTGIHDSIYHRIIVLDDGTTQFYLVSTEVCEFSPSVYDHVAAQLISPSATAERNLEVGIHPSQPPLKGRS